MPRGSSLCSLKDGYNLKKEQVLNIVYSAINDMAIEKLKQTKAGCLVIRATEEEAKKIAISNPDLFVESDVIHERYF